MKKNTTTPISQKLIAGARSNPTATPPWPKSCSAFLMNCRKALSSSFLLAFALTILPIAVHAESKPQRPRQIHKLHLTLKVAQLDTAVTRILTQAQKQDAFVQRRYSRPKTERFTLKVAIGDQLRQLLAFIKKQGIVIKETNETTNIGAKLARYQADLTSWQKHLNELYKLMNHSDFEETLELEKEIQRVVSRIETLKGKIRYLKRRSRMATVRVSFQFEPPVDNEYQNLGIPWVRLVGIKHFMDKF